MPSLEDWTLMIFSLISALVIGILSALAPLCAISVCTEKRSDCTLLCCPPFKPSSNANHKPSTSSAFHPSLILEALSRSKQRLGLFCGIGIAFSLLYVWLGNLYHFPIFALTMPQSLFILLLASSAVLIASEIALYDIETRTIPYEYSACLFLVGFAYVLLSRPRDLGFDLIAAILIFTILLGISFFELWKNISLSLGAGDIVLIPIISFIVGFDNFVPACALSLAIGLTLLVAQRAYQKKKLALKESIPFGPMLALCLSLGLLISIVT